MNADEANAECGVRSAEAGHLTPALSPSLPESGRGEGGRSDAAGGRGAGPHSALRVPHSALAYMAGRVAARLTPPFRGEVWENARRFQLIGKAYEAMPAEQKGYFDIHSARHLIGPLRAWRHPDIRKILIRKAVQTQGSLVTDLIIPYIIEHEPRNTLVLFETDPKAMNYCSVRLMDTLKRHPVIGGMITSVMEENRHDATTTFIKFPTMTLMVGGLNDGNVSSLSWPNVIVSEAWFHKSDGLLYKAFGRATQFERDCKILVESQAAMEGDDFSRECDLAWRIPLTWACPECGGRQEFEFSQTRPGDFVPKAPNSKLQAPEKLQIPSSNTVGPGTYSGMKFPAAEEVLNGLEAHLTPEERAVRAEWECYHCGARLRDTPALRRQLMASYEQALPTPAPRAVLFDWPCEASLNVSFAESARQFLSADAAQRLGNIIPKQDWYMQRRAKTWSPQLDQQQATVTVGSYDPNQVIPDEHSRDMAVDCQKHETLDTVGTFWYEAAAVDKFGNARQLARGFARSWEEWIAVQKKFKIPNNRVVIDASKWTPQIMQRAAAEYEVVEGTFMGRPMKSYQTWRIYFGDDARSFKHADGQSRGWSPPRVYPTQVFLPDGKRVMVKLFSYRWSNLSYKLQLDNIRLGMPGAPRYEVLDRKALDAVTQAKEVGDLTYEKQMSAEYLTEKKGKQIYEKLRKNNHYFDCRCMLLVRMSQDGLIGHVSEAPVPVEAVRSQ